MNFKTFLLTASAMVCAAPAFATDLPQKAPSWSVPYTGLSWTGVYVGGNVGYGFGNTKTSDNATNTSGPLFGLPQNFLPAAGRNFTGSNRSFGLGGMTYGGQVGYDQQVGNMVYGAVVDFDWANVSGNDSFVASAAGPGYATQSQVNWFGTARGRVGYAWGNFLPYVTGGVALMNGSAQLTVQPGTFAKPIAPAFVQSASQTELGYVVGAGLEYRIAQNWSANVEYLFLDGPKKQYQFNYGNAGLVSATASVSENIVRAGLSYRF
jgi:outer membrane immunogenic protein